MFSVLENHYFCSSKIVFAGHGRDFRGSGARRLFSGHPEQFICLWMAKMFQWVGFGVVGCAVVVWLRYGFCSVGTWLRELVCVHM